MTHISHCGDNNNAAHCLEYYPNTPAPTPAGHIVVKTPSPVDMEAASPSPTSIYPKVHAEKSGGTTVLVVILVICVVVVLGGGGYWYYHTKMIQAPKLYNPLMAPDKENELVDKTFATHDL